MFFKNTNVYSFIKSYQSKNLSNFQAILIGNSMLLLCSSPPILKENKKSLGIIKYSNKNFKENNLFMSPPVV